MTSVTTATSERVIFEKSMYAFAMGEAMGAVTSLKSTIRMASSFSVHRFSGGTPPGGYPC
jgi:hypothetical protein